MTLALPHRFLVFLVIFALVVPAPRAEAGLLKDIGKAVSNAVSSTVGHIINFTKKKVNNLKRALQEFPKRVRQAFHTAVNQAVDRIFDNLYGIFRSGIITALMASGIAEFPLLLSLAGSQIDGTYACFRENPSGGKRFLRCVKESSLKKVKDLAKAIAEGVIASIQIPLVEPLLQNEVDRLIDKM